MLAAMCCLLISHFTPEGDRKNFHGAVVVHPTLYDGCLEMAGLKMGFTVLSTSGQPASYSCGKDIVKDHLLEVG